MSAEARREEERRVGRRAGAPALCVMSARRQPIASTTLRVRSACGPQRSILQLPSEGAPMSDTILAAGLPANALTGTTGLAFARSRSLSERDEFGTLDG